MLKNGETNSRLFQMELRYAVHYWNVAEAASKLFNAGGSELQKGLHIFESEWENIETAHRWASENAEQNFYAAEMMHFYANTCVRYFELRLDATTWISWLKGALETSLKHDELKKNAITHTGNLGAAYSNAGEPHEAIRYIRKHLALARQTGDKSAEQSAISNLGILYRNFGRTNKAIRFFEKSQFLAVELKNRAAEGNALGNLGTAYAIRNEHQQSLNYHHQSLTIFAELGDRRAVGNKLNDIGLLLLDLGQPDFALGFFKDFLEIARSFKERRTEATALGNLGKAYAIKQDYWRSLDLSEQHRQIAAEIGDTRSEVIALGNLGATMGILGNREISKGYFTKSLELARSIGDAVGEATASYNYAQVLFDDGKIAEAVKRAETAHEIFRRIGAKTNSEKVKTKLKVWRTMKQKDILLRGDAIKSELY